MSPPVPTQVAWLPPLPSPTELLVGSGAGVAGRLASPVARAVLRSGLQQLFVGEEGSESEPLPAGDHGWFGPGSAVWQVHAETSMFVGGIAALAMQALHPLAMAGVADHSAFSEDPIGRLQRTSAFVGATAFGTVAEAERACAQVRDVHGRVVGTAPDGRPYAASDPTLLDWVHVTEFGAFAAAHRRYAACPLDAAGLDRYVDEVATIAVALGDPTPPRSWAELQAHLAEHRRSAVIGEQAREAWRFLEDPPLPASIRAVWPILFRGAMACLPPWATDLWVSAARAAPSVPRAGPSCDPSAPSSAPRPASRARPLGWRRSDLRNRGSAGGSVGSLVCTSRTRGRNHAGPADRPRPHRTG